MNRTRYALIASLLLCSASAFTQSPHKESPDKELADNEPPDKEPAAILELGGAAGLSLTDGIPSVGPNLAVEVTPIEHWLELEAGVTPLFGRHSTEWDIDLLFKKPWTLSRKVEFMAGVGPEWIRTSGSGTRTNSLGAEAALDFMFWPSAKHKFGWYLETGLRLQLWARTRAVGRDQRRTADRDPLKLQKRCGRKALRVRPSSDNPHLLPVGGTITPPSSDQRNRQRKEFRKWTSKEVAHSLPAKDLPSGLPAPYALTLCSRQTIPARAVGASVTFEPGARTAWHTHPLGQTLIVTAGCGRAQRWGGPIEEIRPGDVVWFAPGEKHWHGATPTTAMTHIAIQEQLDGKAVDWMEKVSDEQYEDTHG